MRLFTFLPLVLLLAVPAVAQADRDPDFDDDAKPILRLQPGLLKYVETNFEVKDTGIAKYPGGDDRPPQPPFMFQARERGKAGPYHLVLLIQPGPINHILNVVDMNRVHLNGLPPGIAPQQPSSSPQTPPAPNASAGAKPASANQTPAPPQMPTSDTPSGPIQASPASHPASNPPSLQPPPDPPPTSS
ncbi:MAG TPA: hypothetical protein VL981_02300 [Candidatus Methylacidiphilales bacterium]|nr:hypothetical protein [Candidatus Methylacidiphilales bacterium]